MRAELLCSCGLLLEHAGESLLIDAPNGTIPPFCPHGRPCVLKITRKELEKQFGRLV